MKRTAVMMAVAMAMLVSAGVTPAVAQETVAAGPASPVEGGKKSKTMTVVGDVKSVAADSLAISDESGKDWTFAIDRTTKVIPPAKETVDVAPASPVEGGKVMPSKPEAGKETVDVAPASPVEGGKQIQTKTMTVSDIKEGQRVQVSYHTVDGKMHATQVRMK